MLLQGKFTIKADLQETWESLIKPETLGACIPGCERMVAIDSKSYDTIVVAKVGFISVKFQFTTTLTELNPPTRLKAIGKGHDLFKQGNFTQETVLELKEISENEIEVSYKSSVMIVGRLATFGDRIMRVKAKELEKQFTKNLRERLSTKQAN